MKIEITEEQRQEIIGRARAITGVFKEAFRKIGEMFKRTFKSIKEMVVQLADEKSKKKQPYYSGLFNTFTQPKQVTGNAMYWNEPTRSHYSYLVRVRRNH